MTSSKISYVVKFEMCLNQFGVADNDYNHFCVCCNVCLFKNPDIPKSELDYRCIFGFTSFLEILFIGLVPWGFLRFAQNRCLVVAEGCRKCWLGMLSRFYFPWFWMWQNNFKMKVGLTRNSDGLVNYVMVVFGTIFTKCQHRMQ